MALVYNAVPTPMRRLREVLVNEYIGAIAIGFLLAQAAGGVIGVILQPLITYFENRSRRQSIFAAPPSVFNWPQLILGIVSIVLHLLAALLLYLWLYRKKKLEPAVAGAAPIEIEDDDDLDDESEESS